jgi:hypothetical protein|tara:strand:+ start:1986 stop:2177 length:192 start_codon:yes stop_codon:yes gene_type:complete
MAENSVSAAPSGRDISSSRLTNSQSDEKAERQVRVIARQENSQKVRAQAIAETQTGRKINIRT